MVKAKKTYNNGGKVYGKDKEKRNALTVKTKRYQQEGLKGDTRSLKKVKVRGGADNNTFKKKTTTYDGGVGTVTKEKRTSGGKRKEKSRKISGKAAHRAIKGSMGRSYKDPNKEMKNGGKIVAQGADKKDLRREKKQERKEAKAVKRAKRGEKSKTRTIGNRTVIKQKNKSDDGVRSTRKTVYGGNQAQRMVTKEKQRTNTKGKKAGMISFKEKEVDRKDFSVRRKTKGITPNSGS